MLEKSAAAVQTAPSRPIVKIGRTESLTERIDRINDSISRRAYELFEMDGRVDGNDKRHWLEAEEEFLLPVQVDLEESDRAFDVRAKVPGFSASDLEVNVEPRRITIAGKRESRKETKEGQATYTQESYDEIFRVVDLPSEVTASKVSAMLKDGVLDIQLPKAESRKSAPVLSQPT